MNYMNMNTMNQMNIINYNHYNLGNEFWDKNVKTIKLFIKENLFKKLIFIMMMIIIQSGKDLNLFYLEKEKLYIEKLSKMK